MFMLAWLAAELSTSDERSERCPAALAYQRVRIAFIPSFASILCMPRQTFRRAVPCLGEVSNSGKVRELLRGIVVVWVLGEMSCSGQTFQVVDVVVAGVVVPVMDVAPVGHRAMVLGPKVLVIEAPRARKVVAQVLARRLRVSAVYLPIELNALTRDGLFVDSGHTWLHDVDSMAL